MFVRPCGISHRSHSQPFFLCEVCQPSADLIPPVETCFQASVKDEGLEGTFLSISLLPSVPRVCPLASGKVLHTSEDLSYFSCSTLRLHCITWMYLVKTQLVGWVHTCSMAGAPQKSNHTRLWKVWLVSPYCCLWQILLFPATFSSMKIAVHLFCPRKGTSSHLGFSLMA